MLLIQVEKTLGPCFLSGEIGKAIDNLLVLFSLLFYPSSDLKNLGNPRPLALKKVVHLRTRPDFAHFSPPMPFLDLFVLLPFPPVQILIGKKIHEILMDPRLVLFNCDQIIALIGMDSCTPLLLSMHRIGTNDAAFHQNRMQEGC